MKYAVLVLGCILALAAHAQQLDTIIHFPDSMGYCFHPVAVAHNPVTGRVYVVNRDDVGGAFVFDPAMRTKVRFIRGEFGCAVYCAGVNKVYLGGDGVLVVLDAGADSVIRTIEIDVTSRHIVYNSQNEKLYVLSDDGQDWAVLDAVADSVLGYLDEMEGWIGPVWDSAANRVYAADYDAGRVQALDCESDTVVAEVVLHEYYWVTGMVFAPAGRKLYCDTEADTTYIVDVDSFRVVGAVGGLSGPLAHNPGLNRVYGTRGDTVVVVDCANDSVRALVPAGEAVTFTTNPADNRTYVTLSSPAGIAALDAGDSVAAFVALDTVGTPAVTGGSPARRELYCAMESDNVAILDCRGDSLAGVMNYAHYIIRGVVHASVGNKLYLLFTDRDTVLVLGSDHQTAAAISVPMLRTTVTACYNQGQNRLYIADSTRLWVIDCGADTLIGGHEMPGMGRADVLQLLPLLGKLYVFHRRAPYECWVYDCVRDTMLGFFSMPARVLGAAWHPWSSQVYVALYQTPTIGVIDPRADSLVQTISAGRRNSGNTIFAHTGNGRVYFADNSTRRWLFTVDVRANTVVDSVSLPDDADEIFRYRRTDKLYLCDRTTSGIVTVFDCNSGTVTGTLNLPCVVGAQSEATERLYLAGRDVVHTLDCRTDSTVATFAVPATPDFCAVNVLDNRIYFAEQSNWLAVFQDALGLEEGGPGTSPQRFRVLGNPARGTVRFECRVAPGEPGRFAAFDAGGRMVRRMDVAGRAGTVRFTWDGRDTRGRPVSRGVYFCRLETSAVRATVKVVLD